MPRWKRCWDLIAAGQLPCSWSPHNLQQCDHGKLRYSSSTSSTRATTPGVFGILGGGKTWSATVVGWWNMKKMLNRQLLGDLCFDTLGDHCIIDSKNPISGMKSMELIFKKREYQINVPERGEDVHIWLKSFRFRCNHKVVCFLGVDFLLLNLNSRMGFGFLVHGFIFLHPWKHVRQRWTSPSQDLNKED